MNILHDIKDNLSIKLSLSLYLLLKWCKIAKKSLTLISNKPESPQDSIITFNGRFKTTRSQFSLCELADYMTIKRG